MISAKAPYHWNTVSVAEVGLVLIINTDVVEYAHHHHRMVLLWDQFHKFRNQSTFHRFVQQHYVERQIQ